LCCCSVRYAALIRADFHRAWWIVVRGLWGAHRRDGGGGAATLLRPAATFSRGEKESAKAPAVRQPSSKLVPTLCVGIPSSTLRVADSRPSLALGHPRSGGTRSVQDRIPTETVGTSGGAGATPESETVGGFFSAANPPPPPTRTDDCKAANRLIFSVDTKAQLSPRAAQSICYSGKCAKMETSELRPGNRQRIFPPCAAENGRGRARPWGRKEVCHVQRRGGKGDRGQEAML